MSLYDAPDYGRSEAKRVRSGKDGKPTPNNEKSSRQRRKAAEKEKGKRS